VDATETELASMPPSDGELFAVIVDSDQAVVTYWTLKLPAVFTAFTYSFKVAFATLAPV
jgi:hypothetical protein